MSAEVLDAESSSSSPPPPPVAVAEENKRDIFHQAARASWRAPIVAILFGMVSFTLREQSRTVAIIIGGANVLIILLGLIFSIVALCGMRGRRGIIAPATIGLVINLVLVVLMAAGISAAMRYQNIRGPVAIRTGSGATVPRETPSGDGLPPLPGLPAVPPVPAPGAAPISDQAAKEQQRALEAIEQYPGWVGVSTRAGNLTLVIVQSNNDAPGTQDVKAHFATPCTLVWVCVNNTAGDMPHVVEARSLEFHMADYSQVTPLPAAQITATAKQANDPLLARGERPLAIASYTQMPDCPVFFPEKTDFTKATAATLIVDKQRIVIPGRYLSLEEKQENLRKSRQQQQQKQPQPKAQ